jgi:hypothetical protein
MTSFIGFVRSGSRVEKLKFDGETGLKARFVDREITRISGQKSQAFSRN